MIVVGREVEIEVERAVADGRLERVGGDDGVEVVHVDLDASGPERVLEDRDVEGLVRERSDQ